MKAIPADSILTEVHAVKDSLSAEFNHDVVGLCRHLRAGERVARGEVAVVNQPAFRGGGGVRTRAKPRAVA